MTKGGTYDTIKKNICSLCGRPPWKERVGAMHPITLDVTGCQYLNEIHQRIKEAFGFPEWYEANWDAFWDLLNEPREHTMVTVCGLKSFPKGSESSGDMIIRLLEKNKEFYAQYMKRQTQFDYRFEY